MKIPKQFADFFKVFSNPLLVIVLISSTAIIFKFDGVIKLDLGIDGGKFLLDGRENRQSKL